MQFYMSMSNCICGANNLYKWFEYCHLAEPILFPIHLYCKHRLNKYKSWHNFKMKSPKNLQANPSKSQLSVMFYHLNIKEKIRYFKTKSQFIANKFKTSASCILSHILATTFLQLPPGSQWAPSPYSEHSCWTAWWLAKGINVLECHLNDSFDTFWPSDVYQLYLTLE